MKRIFLLTKFIFLLFLMSNCNLDSLDFGNLSKEVNLNPEIVAPLAKANITVWDLINTANKEKDTNSGIAKIVYRQNDLFKYNVSELLDLPLQQNFYLGDKQLGEISPANISVSKSITLNELTASLGGAISGLIALDGTNAPFPIYSFNGPFVSFKLDQINDYTSITLSKGSLEISMENKLKVPVSIKGSLYDLAYNKKIKDEFTFNNIAPGGTSKVTLDLAGIVLSNRIEFRMISFETPGSATPVGINLNDYFKLTFDLKNLGISKGNLMITTAQQLEGNSGVFGFIFPEPDMKAFTMQLKKGTLNIKMTNSSNLKGVINFTLNEIKRNGVAIKATIPLSGNSTSIDLSGTDINFTSDQVTPYNRIPYSYSITVDKTEGYINYASTDVIKMDVALQNMEFKTIQGDFGKRVIQIDPSVFEMNVDMFNNINGGFKLANPTMELIIRNSIGMPATVGLNFIASSKEGKTAALNPPVFDIPVPANINSGIATKSIVFNKQNSNIVSFIALPPTSQVAYNGKVDFNKSNLVTPQNPNFLDADATFAIDLAMELPLELQIKDLTFKDTTAISGSDFENLESAELIITATNQMPLDFDFQLQFVDTISKKQYWASKVTKILTAAPVNAAQYKETSVTFSLSKSEVEILKKSNGVVFYGIVISPAGETGIASLLYDRKIEMNVVIKSKLNL